MNDVVVIGTGGHAREVYDVLVACGQYTLCGWLTDDTNLHGSLLRELPVLGSPEWLLNYPEVATIIAVGSNSVRHTIAQRLPPYQKYAQAISPHALVAASAQVAPGVMIFPQVVIGPDTALGAHTILNVAATLSHDSTAEDVVNINPGAHVAGNVRLQRGVYLGISSSVIQGVSIGAWTTVGAGAAVIRDLPSHVTAVGVPAKVIKKHA